ncbi:YutD-like domain-containing protein [Brevibacillus sp. SYSU BS000544]|uniref:YutD family protein n=1 Tax=Brevibacillus sp. SYSU BS000544 TaxID=3416443 RepID=UPI003CE56D58
MIRTQAGVYEVMEESRSGWNHEAFKERYSDILDKYDYIVGDWGYSQLRLRGFYENTNKKAPFEQKIAALDEYLQEFCNFGCAYFVLKRVRTLGANTLDDSVDEITTNQGGTEESSSEPSVRYDRKHPRFDRPNRPQRPRPDRPDRNAKEQSNPSNERTDRPNRNNRNEQKEKQGKNFRADRSNKDRRNSQFSNRPNREKVTTEASQNNTRRTEEKNK